jgi:5'-methylthioadenosine phosphorylase
MRTARIGIIGGSGLYQMSELEHVSELDVRTPFGRTSDRILVGQLGQTDVAFLARHGRHHSLLPHEVPYRANIHALKQLGVEYLVAVSAVGSLREGIRPLDIVLPSQYVDLTKSRASTFFGQEVVAHVSMAEPVCPALVRVLKQSALEVVRDEVAVHGEGTYVCIEGPQFSTRAESQMYRLMGADVIGMTNMPEAKLAREAEIAYATFALVTDWDCWHPHQSCVTAEMAIANLSANAQRARSVIAAAIRAIDGERPPSNAHRALDSALVTGAQAISGDAAIRLKPILGRVLQARGSVRL